MNRTSAALIVSIAILPSCHAASGEEMDRAAPAPPPQAAPDAAHHAHAAAVTPQRETRWALLQGWVRGASVNREPTRCPPDDGPALAARGKELFGLYCVNCHGPEGRGDGPRSNVFDPPPRDLAKGIFKFRTTPSGSPPLAEDLFRTISGGLRGTGMMPFVDLPEDDRWALVVYVQTLSRAQVGAAAALAVPAPRVDESTPARVARGRRSYEKLGCSTCHGHRGRGDGESAGTLRDDLGRPVHALDFATKPLKRGDDPTDLVWTMMTGLDGTPMPSYADAASVADLRDVAAFVLSLRTDDAGAVDPRDREEAARLVQGQYAQAVHTVVGGCGCRH